MKKVFKPSGICSSEIGVEVEDGVIKDVNFTGGCAGNAEGMSRLVAGMSTDEAIRRLKGIKCGRKNTSCPDQLALALEEMYNDKPGSSV